jgi:hypothetical protein
MRTQTRDTRLRSSVLGNEKPAFAHEARALVAKLLPPRIRERNDNTISTIHDKPPSCVSTPSLLTLGHVLSQVPTSRRRDSHSAGRERDGAEGILLYMIADLTQRSSLEKSRSMYCTLRSPKHSRPSCGIRASAKVSQTIHSHLRTKTYLKPHSMLKQKEKSE